MISCTRSADRIPRLCALTLACAFLCTAVSTIGAQTLLRSVDITVDNDYFDFWRPPDQRSDDNYTQGLRIHADTRGIPSFLRSRLCAKQDACGSAVEIGQEMYTPTDDAPRLLPGERPYAGWLYLRGSADAATANERRTLSATIGVTGPPSLAAEAQEEFHHMVRGFRTPLGWSGQLPAEPDFALQGEVDRHLAPESASHWVDLIPEVHATLGTVRTAAGAGTRARLGVNLTHPWMREAHPSWFEGYAFVGVQGELVARDLFLDGGTFRRSPSVSREPLIGDWERGVVARVGHVELEYRAVTTSREYVTGPHSHTFGGITLGYDVSL